MTALRLVCCAENILFCVCSCKFFFVPVMSMAWRATDPLERISYARKAIEANEKSV